MHLSPGMPNSLNVDEQDDSFFGMLTVKETLKLACALQPRGAIQTNGGSSRTRRTATSATATAAAASATLTTGAASVDEWLRRLGLWEVRNARVGDQIHRGILFRPTHPFLPYVAPDFSHISHVNLVL